jgi:pyridoxine kinase
MIRGTEEMRIVESGDLLAHPKRRFDAIAVHSD